jgi:heptosyltransferase III
MSALLYHAGALGDFLTTVPALRHWKLRNPGEKLVLLGQPRIGELAKDIGLIDEVFDVNDSRFPALFFEQSTSEAQAILSPFRTAILFAAPDSQIIENVRRSGIAKHYWQPPFPSAKEKIHIIDYHHSLFVDPKSLNPEEKQPHLFPSTESMQRSFAIMPENNSPVAVHPGSGSPRKNWPFERFGCVADTIRSKNIPVLWLAGPADGAFAFPREDTIVVNQPLSVCAALLSRCRAFIGNDSGIAHLAAGVGCPTIALFGPSDPAVWSPRGRQVDIIYKKMPCSPCHRSLAADTTCTTDCLSAITVDEVIDKIYL